MSLPQKNGGTSRKKPSPFVSQRLNRKAVFIKRENKETIAAHIEFLIETAFLQKFDRNGYYNSCSGNLRLWATFVVACLVSGMALVFAGLAYGLCLHFGAAVLEVKFDFISLSAAAFVFTGFWIGLFWQEKSRIYSKWEYLAILYNDVIGRPVTSRDMYSERDILRIALAMDILKLEMWAHSSFDSVFKEILADAIHADLKLDKATAEEEVRHLCTTGIDRKRADKYLLDYQMFVASVIRNTKAA